MVIYDYKQKIKNQIRHMILSNAINYLTVNREKACCVPRTYVRDVADYFLMLDEDEPAYKEAKKIDPRYISAWETLHDSVVGHKLPFDLSICYLSGAQPQNDFDELINLGVLPQNIWAFENDKATYYEAIHSYNSPIFPQPKILKMSVEQFFKQSPKKFDIVYIDACGTILSSQHALRNVSTLIQHQRLNSPGVLITNFSMPDIEKPNILKEYAYVISLYLIFKENPNAEVNFENNKVTVNGMDILYSKIISSFEEYYSEFVSNILSDISAIIVPLQRFSNIAPFSNLFDHSQIKDFLRDSTTLEEINEIKHNSVCKWLLTLDFIRNEERPTLSTFRSLCTDILSIDGNWKDLINGIKIFTRLKKEDIIVTSEIAAIKDYFNKPQNLYRFLDKPTVSLFYDMVINQLTYPLHSNIHCCDRYQYCAKSTKMFTDITILDECRYLYEWLPAIHQITNAMQNNNWQYVFRFALDGLVKQRLNYNNEFFFQGSVISKDEKKFAAEKREKRAIIGG